MKILLVDRDHVAMENLQNILVQDGHEVATASVRKEALEMIAGQRFDIIAIDPAPLPSARQMTLPMRWQRWDHYFYLMLLGREHEEDLHDVIHSGMNDKILKPYNQAEIRAKITNAQRLTGFMERLGKDGAVISDGQIFGPRAFYQLVLSALDRTYRYNEQAYLVVIRLNNFDGLEQRIGTEKANHLLQRLGEFLSKLHRMSDFLGHTAQTEYVLLILRPALDKEPHDAAERFAQALRDFQDDNKDDGFVPEFVLELWSLPSGAVEVEARLQS